MSGNTPCRRYRFTVNNWTPDLKAAILAEEKFSYVIVGEEIAPTTGTPHLQCYCELHKPGRFGPFAKKFKAAFLTCEQSQIANIDYCKKDGVFEERGVPKADPLVGGDIEKERWARNIKLAEAGKLEELKDIDPAAYTRMYKTYKQMMVDHMQPIPALAKLDNHWFWGPPGVGKSLKARQIAGDVFYPKQLNKWWDGYNGEKVVIIDDFERESHLDHHLKIWADHYDFIGETKGGSLRIRPETIIVTSNYSPDECFKDEALAAIRRRFKVTHMISL